MEEMASLDVALNWETVRKTWSWLCPVSLLPSPWHSLASPSLWSQGHFRDWLDRQSHPDFVQNPHAKATSASHRALCLHC